MPKGIIYVMSSCIDGLVKIGKTGSSNFEQRMSLIERDGYHRVSVLNREFAIEVEDYDEKEKLVHEIFSKSRVGDSELFAVDVNLVKQLMASMDGNVIYPPGETKNEIFELATEIVETKSGIIPDGIYSLQQRNRKTGDLIDARMLVENGKLTLQTGSFIADISKISVKGWITVRESMKIESHRLIENVECDSPSMAAALVVGHNANGWDLWTNDKGVKISSYRENESFDK